MKWLLAMVLFNTVCRSVPTRTVVGGAPVAREATALNADTIRGTAHFAHGFPAEPVDPPHAVNAVVEIPAGTTAKFEVADADGWLHWARDRDHGGRREIDYLPFPVNYGMVPRTLAPDGDALDIIVLGRGLERGHVGATRVIGVLAMADGDVRDDKLLAVPLELDLRNGFSTLTDLADLDRRYPHVREELALWFASYWGPGRTTVLGWGDRDEALTSLRAAEDAFKAIAP